MKDCPKCGEICSDNSKFCSSCGYSFEESTNVNSPSCNLEAEPAAEVKKGL